MSPGPESSAMGENEREVNRWQHLTAKWSQPGSSSEGRGEYILILAPDCENRAEGKFVLFPPEGCTQSNFLRFHLKQRQKVTGSRGVCRHSWCSKKQKGEVWKGRQAVIGKMKQYRNERKSKDRLHVPAFEAGTPGGCQSDQCSRFWRGYGEGRVTGCKMDTRWCTLGWWEKKTARREE